MKTHRKFMRTLGAIIFTSIASTAAIGAPPFGDAASIEYSQKLWQSLVAANLAGPKAIMSKAYKGQHPHGAVLDTIEGKVAVGGHTGDVIVKRNYGGKDVSTAQVADNPAKYLGAVTVMYKREVGYDADNRDWFWAKYKPDGSLHANPKGMKLAGRVAKGKPKGCIACHRAAPGGDMVYNNDRHK
jgi:hypothetical protein